MYKIEIIYGDILVNELNETIINSTFVLCIDFTSVICFLGIEIMWKVIYGFLSIMNEESGRIILIIMEDGNNFMIF